MPIAQAMSSFWNTPSSISRNVFSQCGVQSGVARSAGIVIEKRSVLWPLAVGLLLNIAAYALIVRPKEMKVKSADVRSAAAAQALKAAERDLASARALVAGKSQAEEALSTFYNKVLPADF